MFLAVLVIFACLAKAAVSTLRVHVLNTEHAHAQSLILHLFFILDKLDLFTCSITNFILRFNKVVDHIESRHL